jgi:hypothetical protein
LIFIFIYFFLFKDAGSEILAHPLLNKKNSYGTHYSGIKSINDEGRMPTGCESSSTGTVLQRSSP